jgi:putative oxidoreductase
MDHDALRSTTFTIFRVVVGFTFSLHGMQKLFGFFGGLGGNGATVHFPNLLWFAGVIELFGGLLILAGFMTRPVALILCGEMAVGYFIAHFPHGFWPIRNGGELAVLYCFAFLYLFGTGAGDWSLDGLISARR